MAENKPVPTEGKAKTIRRRYDHVTEQMRALVDELSKETDRACVIIAAARADYLLSQILAKHLIPNTASQDDLLDSDRALGTFSARINVVFRLGLIDAEFARALHLLRKMRNSFAHEASTVNLDKASHRDRVREIIAPLIRYDAFESFKSSVIKSKEGIAADFCTGVSVIIGRLENFLEAITPIHQKQFTTYVPPKWIDKAKDKDEEKDKEKKSQ